LTVSVPDAVPTVVGVNVTEIVQFLPAAREEPQVLFTAKGLPVPVAMLLMEIAAVVLFVRVKFLAALVLLTATLPKLRLVVLSDTWADAAREVRRRNKATRMPARERVRTMFSPVSANWLDLPPRSGVILLDLQSAKAGQTTSRQRELLGQPREMVV
jgi:hypothetical protein